MTTRDTVRVMPGTLSSVIRKGGSGARPTARIMEVTG